MAIPTTTSLQLSRAVQNDQLSRALGLHVVAGCSCLARVIRLAYLVVVGSTDEALEDALHYAQ